jgi:hypothetical protein
MDRATVNEISSVRLLNDLRAVFEIFAKSQKKTQKGFWNAGEQIIELGPVVSWLIHPSFLNNH